MRDAVVFLIDFLALVFAAFGLLVFIRYVQLELRRRRRMRELKYGGK
jgi:hypothetical protein